MKPIAWMSHDGKVSQTEGKLFHIPLYVAPKQLSDDEIWKVGESLGWDFKDKSKNNVFLKFARAIEERHGIK